MLRSRGWHVVLAALNCQNVSPTPFQKLQMTDITLKAAQHSAMEVIYNRQDVFVWLPTGYGKSLCCQVLPFIMDYKHGVAETKRHSLVLVENPLVAWSIVFIRKCHKIYLAQFASFLSLRNNSTLINTHVQTVCTRPSPPPILEGLGTRLVHKAEDIW